MGAKKGKPRSSKELYFGGHYSRRAVLELKYKNDRRDIASIIKDTTTLTFREAFEAFDAVIGGIIAILLRDGHVVIPRIGHFYLRHVHVMRKNKTFKDSIRIYFRPSFSLRSNINHNEEFKKWLKVDMDVLNTPFNQRYREKEKG